MGELILGLHWTWFVLLNWIRGNKWVFFFQEQGLVKN